MGALDHFSPPRKLTPGDSVEAFHCGTETVDTWVKTHARHAEKRGTAIVYAVYCGETLAGLYSLSSHAVVRSDVSGGWLKRNAPEAIPAILLGILGVDTRFQGQGLGASLLGDALRRALSASEQIGAKALLVDPADDNARAFYEKFGFKPVPGLNRLFIPLKINSTIA